MRSRSKRLIWPGAVVAAAAGAAYLALRRGDIPYDELARRYAARTSRFLNGPDGVVIHYRDDGPAAGPVLVLLHGFAASSLDWLPWIERLRQHYRIISLDLPGHGLTAAPPGLAVTTASLVALVDAVATRLDLGRFVLVGNSMGGRVACQFAVDRPGRLAGLVLVNAVSATARPPDAPSPVFRLLATGLGRAILRRIDLTPLVRRSLAVALGDPGLVTPALVRRYTDLSRAPGHRTIMTSLQLDGAGAAEDGLAALDVPTLVMVGEDDKLVPAAEGRRTARAIPGATLIAYPGVGHVPMQQIPGRSARDLDHWIRDSVAWS